MQSIKAKLNELKQKIIDGLYFSSSSTVNSDNSVSYEGLDHALINKRRGLNLHKNLKGHFGMIYALDWSGHPHVFFSASQDGRLLIWDTHTGSRTCTISLASSWVMCCACEKQTNQIAATGGLDSLCSIYRVSHDNGKIERELSGHDGYIASCKFVGTSRILTASGDGTVCLWDIEKEYQLITFEGHQGDVMTLSICPNDNNLFLSGSCDAKAKLWDMRTKTSVQTFSGHESDVNSVSFHPNGNEFATGSDDATCRLWDIRSFSEIGKYQNERQLSSITCLDYSKSGRILFLGRDDYSFHAWDTINPQEQLIVASENHGNRVSCLGVNSKGDMLATGSWDTRINIWS